MEIMGVKLVSLRDLIAYETSKAEKEAQELTKEQLEKSPESTNKLNLNTP